MGARTVVFSRPCPAGSGPRRGRTPSSRPVGMQPSGTDTPHVQPHGHGEVSGRQTTSTRRPPRICRWIGLFFRPSPPGLPLRDIAAAGQRFSSRCGPNVGDHGTPSDGRRWPPWHRTPPPTRGDGSPRWCSGTSKQATRAGPRPAWLNTAHQAVATVFGRRLRGTTSRRTSRQSRYFGPESLPAPAPVRQKFDPGPGHVLRAELLAACAVTAVEPCAQGADTPGWPAISSHRKP